MFKSLRELLSESIDFSGISTPDEDGLRTALRNYLTFAHSGFGWMQSRFVIPHHLIPKLSKFSDQRDKLQGPLSLCITGPETDTLHQFTNVITSIEREVLSVHSDYPGEVRTNILELKFPVGSVEKLNPKDLVRSLERVVNSAAESRLLPHRVFFEVPGETFNAELTKKIIKVIAVHNKSILKRKIDNYLFSGIKINCGSTHPKGVAEEEYLADVILYARDANVAIKFNGDINTAFPGYDYIHQKKVHGFMNVFMAAVLAYTQDLTLEETIEVLKEDQADHFSFQDQYVAWRELAAPMMEVKMLRMLSITSFNISDYSKPLEGLKVLDLI